VGASLAGLSCARHLAAAGIPFVILEASRRIGGRIKTDRVDDQLPKVKFMPLAVLSTDNLSIALLSRYLLNWRFTDFI